MIVIEIKSERKVISMNEKPMAGGLKNKRPISKYKAGAIEAAIFNNEREHNGVIVGFKTISLSRSYKKHGEDLWRHENINLRRNDLPKIILVLQKAQEELLLNQKAGEKDD